MTETLPALHRAGAAIYQRLAEAFEGSEVDVHAAPAPESASSPYVTYDLTPSPDTRHKQGVSATNLESVVRVVVEGSSTFANEPLQKIEDAVGMAHHDGVTLRRIAPFALPPYVRDGSNQPTYERGLRVAVRVQ